MSVEDQTKARDEAIARVESTSAAWRSFATNVLLRVARTNPDLTSDDVWAGLHRDGIPDPGEPRAMGPVMLAGVRKGWLTSTEMVRIASDPSSPNHRRPQRVYLSRINEPVSPLRSGQHDAVGEKSNAVEDHLAAPSKAPKFGDVQLIREMRRR
jgi:hypothetical protein